MNRELKSKFQKGFTLIELMIGMALGLLVVGGILAVFLSSIQTVRITDAMARNQENARAVFELLARDLRELSSPVCHGQMINDTINTWWHRNDAILAAHSNNFPAVVAAFPLANQINGLPVDGLHYYTASPVLTGDAVNALNSVCNLSAALGVSNTIGIDAEQTYNPVGWYIGCRNGQSPCNTIEDRSLFYSYVHDDATVAIPIVDNIISMRLRFLEGNGVAYQAIAQNPVWNNVIAVEIQLVFDESGYSNNNRTITHVVQLRSREGV